MGPIADSVVAAFAGATALFDNLGWERMLVIPVLLGGWALAMLAIHRIEASPERRPKTFTSRAVALASKALLSIVIFVVLYALCASLSGPGLPMAMMLGLLMASIVTTIRELTKRRARAAGLRR